MINFVDQEDQCLYHTHVGDAAASAGILLNKIWFDQNCITALDDASKSAGKIHSTSNHF